MPQSRRFGAGGRDRWGGKKPEERGMREGARETRKAHEAGVRAATPYTRDVADDSTNPAAGIWPALR